MKKRRLIRPMIWILILFFVSTSFSASAAPTKNNGNGTGSTKELNLKKITPADRQKAADNLQAMLEAAGETALAPPVTFGLEIDPDTGYLVPDYFGNANWAYSPTNIEKFVDKLAGLGSENKNNLGQYIPIAVPDTTTYPDNPAKNAKASDYYEIAVVEYMEKMHTNLPATKNRGYVQIDTPAIPGDGFPLTQVDGTPIYYPGTTTQVRVVDIPHYLGPAIVSESGRPVRVKFYNLLPIGAAGDLYIPTDTTVMGSGMGPNGTEEYTQNRANVHLHGNNTVWISDGSPHQWITPAGESTTYPQGVSVRGVPDMSDPNDARDGTTTLYYTNTQSSRLMFYHDHSFGITRLNVYAGEAAPYIIRDKVEKDLIDGTNLTGVNPKGFKLPAIEIPLVIQDRTFVDETTILQTDPTWAWGTNPAKPATATTAYVPGTPRTGDLWYPHVYSPAQDPYDLTGANPFGRWMYGPWFYPPTDNIEFPPIPNPYHDATVDPNSPDYRPPMMPGTPNPSAPGESFMDTPLVNGTVYPYLDVDPQAYRFRILNAANDRFFSLSFYVADDTYLPGTPGYLKEVKMIPATPGTLPTHLEQIMPDPGVDDANLGPSWIQIGTEGGFLPTPAVIDPQPTTWNLVGTAFNFGSVATHGLLLGAAERADVIVDFSQYAGKTLIMYNDAPAPFPANDTRYDYFTNNPDQQEIGGAPPTLPGYGPNTRTIMQIRVADATPVPFDTQPLFDVFKKGAIPATATTPANTGVFATGQDTIIIPQAAYNDAYGVTDLPADAASAYVQLDENDKTFTPINREGVKQSPVNLPLEPKAMHDEMSGVFDDYGRMSGFLGLTSPIAGATVAPFISYGYSSPPVELFKGIEEDLDAVQIGSMDDGTQIWQITHNGVDTHPVHVHLFSAQLINRVAWDGAMLPPEENELGWKETFRINPLEQTVIAMRPKVPAASELPFAVPNSERLIDPTMPDGAALPAPPPESWFNPQGVVLREVLNHVVNYGWEYVYHCHILSHEEMDMMHSMAVGVKPAVPTNLTRTISGSGNNRTVVLNWTDNSLNETGFMVQRALSGGGPWTTLATVGANVRTYSNRIGNTNTAYYYKVTAVNTIGDTVTEGFPTITMKSLDSNIVTTGTALAGIPGSPTALTATVQTGPQVLLTWTDNANNESGFLVERSVGTGAFTLITTAPAKSNTGSVTYTDMNVVPGTTYNYRVAAINATGKSAYSNTATVNMTSPPLAPSAVNAIAEIASKRNAKVTITWKDNATTESGFTIERCTNSTFTGPNLVSVNVSANVTTYTTGNVLRNTPYYFRIRANNGAGSSVWVNATPFPVTTP